MPSFRGRTLLFTTSFSNIVIPLITSTIRIEGSALTRARVLCTSRLLRNDGHMVVLVRPPMLFQLRGGGKGDSTLRGSSKFNFKAACNLSGSSSRPSDGADTMKDALFQITTQIFNPKAGKVPNYYEVCIDFLLTQPYVKFFWLDLLNRITLLHKICDLSFKLHTDPRRGEDSDSQTSS